MTTEPDTDSAVPWDELRAFLIGAGPLDGVWFGDRHPTRKGAFWWRNFLPDAAPPEQPAARPEPIGWIARMTMDWLTQGTHAPTNYCNTRIYPAANPEGHCPIYAHPSGEGEDAARLDWLDKNPKSVCIGDVHKGSERTRAWFYVNEFGAHEHCDSLRAALDNAIRIDWPKRLAAIDAARTRAPTGEQP
jgi:hypothetical protein